MIQDLNHAIQLFKEKRYNRESENCLKVDSHYVMKKTRNNKTLFTCDCENSDKTGNIGFCRHKLLFIIYPVLEAYTDKIADLKEYCQIAKTVLSEDEKKLLDKILIQLDEFRDIKIK